MLKVLQRFMAANTKQVFEHDVLAVGDQGFTKAQFSALVRFNDAHEQKFFRVGHNTLRFTEYVGVIQVGDLAIEVLPKVGQASTAEGSKWRRVLVKMLGEARVIGVPANQADLARTKSPLIDLYLKSFLSEARALLHSGLVKRYRREEGNVRALKGRVLFVKQLRYNSIHSERMFTEHQKFDRDNSFNQILKLALSILARSARSADVVAGASELVLGFDGVSIPPITASTLRSLVWRRDTERYRSALQLAIFIIENYSPDLRGGKEHVLAILVDMNKLFEKYVLVQLKRARSLFADVSVQVTSQSQSLFWGQSKVRPDVTIDWIAQGKPQRVILDTKWKLPDAGLPSDADLKQMYAYNLHFGATLSVLVYPHTMVGRSEVKAAFAVGSTAELAHYEHKCAMHFVNLFDESGGFRSDIGTSLLRDAVGVNPVPAETYG